MGIFEIHFNLQLKGGHEIHKKGDIYMCANLQILGNWTKSRRKAQGTARSAVKFEVCDEFCIYYFLKGVKLRFNNC